MHGLLVAVLEGDRCDGPGLMLVAVWEVREPAADLAFWLD